MRPATRAALRTGTVVAGVLVIVATILLCGGAFLVVVLGVGTGYGPPSTAAGWIDAVTRSAHTLLHTSATLAVALIIACAITVLAAFLRSTPWIVVGGVCGILLGLTQLGVAAANSEMDALASRAREAVGSATTAEPLPRAEPEPKALTVPEARAELARMVDATLEAAQGPVVSDTGAPIDPDDVEIRSTACGETGARLGATLTLRTSDNSASLARILAVWDRAGYLPDRAMQEDIRYSTTLPLERMSIRDTTTIDGLLRIGIASACAVAPG
ncbi:hypothetical protein [Microbacterium hominis]|uniref:Uncharacterized protein n=1 Tax=Microbacterium hominis TaxID=162426 RepID=A0A7D4PMP4_9MICO|nr:hypothetical protein [Microbacterium hominis]QKJ19715.1 hypothetical protein HQM25_10290 [Microbacterium hominis]